MSLGNRIVFLFQLFNFCGTLLLCLNQKKWCYLFTIACEFYGVDLYSVISLASLFEKSIRLVNKIDPSLIWNVIKIYQVQLQTGQPECIMPEHNMIFTISNTFKA